MLLKLQKAHTAAGTQQCLKLYNSMIQINESDTQLVYGVLAGQSFSRTPSTLGRNLLLLWFEYEMSPIGSWVPWFHPADGCSFGRAGEPARSGTSLWEMTRWWQALRFLCLSPISCSLPPNCGHKIVVISAAIWGPGRPHTFLNYDARQTPPPLSCHCQIFYHKMEKDDKYNPFSFT